MARPRPELPSAALLTVPPWMWGGAPLQFFSVAGLRARPTEVPRQWQVQTEERYRRIRPTLITVDHLAGPAAPRPRLDMLATAAASPFLPDDGGAFAAERVELRRRADQTHGFVDVWTSWIYETVDAPVAQLPRVVEEIHQSVIATPQDGSPQRLLAGAGVHLFRRAPEVVHRGKLASILHQAEHSPELMTGEIEHLRAAVAAGERVFAASQGLFDGIFVGDAYLGPLLGALTPYVWAFAAHRALGVIVYSLGQPLVGTPARATELLHLLPSQGANDTTALPEVPVNAAAAALDWWAARLSDMFGVLTDPAIFTDRTQIYRPGKHLQALLTVEQLFRRISAIQTGYRDSTARRVLLFTVIDTLERLTDHPIERLCSLRRARGCLERLRMSIPAEAAPILLPAAERGVVALQALQDGFYGCRRRGSDTIDVPSAGGGTRSLDLDMASAEYIKVLRDATHGHGSNKAHRLAITNALLAQHDGKLPHDLALVGYLYLLDVLARPADLARPLYGGGAI